MARNASRDRGHTEGYLRRVIIQIMWSAFAVLCFTSFSHVETLVFFNQGGHDFADVGSSVNNVTQKVMDYDDIFRISWQ